MSDIRKVAERVTAQQDLEYGSKVEKENLAKVLAGINRAVDDLERSRELVGSLEDFTAGTDTSDSWGALGVELAGHIRQLGKMQLSLISWPSKNTQ